jgi:hypothetical protein
MNDELIVKLIETFNGRYFLQDSIQGSYAYFVSYAYPEKKRYKVVWFLENGELYVGVVTAFRKKEV